MKQYFKYILVIFTYFIPFYNKKTNIFVSILNKNNTTGPSRFIYNLEKGFNNNNLKIVRSLFGNCKRALIISSTLPLFYKFCRLFKIKTILRIDGFSIPEYYNNQKYVNRDKRIFTIERMKTNQVIQYGLAVSDYVIFQSIFSYKMSSKYLFNRVDNFKIIYNGVNTNHFIPIKTTPNSELILSVHGTLRDIDIIKCSLEIFKSLKNIMNLKIHYIGTISENIISVITQFIKINKYSLHDIHITGQLSYDKLPEQLSKCDISLHLTSGDSCPNAVLENLSCGVPVIYQKFGGTAELVGSAGVCINTKPYYYGQEVINQVMNAVLKILSNYQTFSEIARERAIKNFKIETMSSNYADIFNEIE